MTDEAGSSTKSKPQKILPKKRKFVISANWRTKILLYSKFAETMDAHWTNESTVIDTSPCFFNSGQSALKYGIEK